MGFWQKRISMYFHVFLRQIGVELVYEKSEATKKKPMQKRNSGQFKTGRCFFVYRIYYLSFRRLSGSSKCATSVYSGSFPDMMLWYVGC